MDKDPEHAPPASDASSYGQDERSLVKLPFTLLGRRGSRKKLREIHSEWEGRDEKGRVKAFFKTVTGDSKYGLPDYPAEEVYVALLYLAGQRNFRDRSFRFVPRQLLRLMHWGDSGTEYKRLEKSLDQLAGVRIKTNALWDEKSKAFVKANFGILDTWKEVRLDDAPLFGEEGGSHIEISWNDELQTFFERGRFKYLNLNTYYSLSSPLAKRLYRWVDEALHPSGRMEIDVIHLAHHRLEMSRSVQYPSQVHQKLQNALDELEACGVCAAEMMDSKTDSGKKYVFVRLKARKAAAEVLVEEGVAPVEGPDVLASLSDAERAELRAKALGRLDEFTEGIRKARGETPVVQAILEGHMRDLLSERKG